MVDDSQNESSQAQPPQTWLAKNKFLQRHLSCLWAATRRTFSHNCAPSAGHVAFMTLLSFFPFSIFLLVITSWVGQNYSAGRFLSAMLEALPPAVAKVLSGPLQQASSLPTGQLLVLTIVIAVWISSSGIEAVRLVVDRAFGMSEDRSFVWRRLQSLFFVLMAPGPIAGILALVIFVPEIWQRIMVDLDVGNYFAFELTGQKKLGRHLLFLSFMYLSAHGLFQFLPARPVRLGWVVPGALLTTVLWFCVGLGFPKIFGVFFRYELIYGSLAGLVLTLIFFYTLALTFILGAEYNGALAKLDGLRREERRDRKTE
jgi:membrane protein